MSSHGGHVARMLLYAVKSLFQLQSLLVFGPFFAAISGGKPPGSKNSTFDQLAWHDSLWQKRGAFRHKRKSFISKKEL
ncbi:hypothetical protein C7441_1068 [Pseudaminobacter salicylatoxidans]|uniref:Uncharacterized protein n=1 Tax=Pseudaminobacter salicylatoxidans TaxID=93369 RepID=A0A316C518_PSESE|nr:hypothetical protein C7441_1068 [Pseudaminobacter salicylatoxidans]